MAGKTKWTRGPALEILARFFGREGNVSAGRYDALVQGCGLPSRSTLVRLFGSFQKAKDAAVGGAWEQTTPAPPEPQGPEGFAASFSADAGIIQIVTVEPLTKDEVLERAGVAAESVGEDLGDWEIAEITTGGWSTPMKLKKSKLSADKKKVLVNEEPMAVRNFKITVRLKRKTPEVKSLESLLEEFRKRSPQVPRLKRPPVKKGTARRELEIDLPDPHLGLRAFMGSSGLPWSIEQCEQVCLEAVERLLALAKPYLPLDRIVWVFGNDFLHSDSVFGKTTQGTPQPDADSWHHVYLRGELLALAIADRLKGEAPLKIIVVPGNHERQTTFTMGRVLAARYASDKNVEVDAGPEPYKFHRHGVNLIGFDHGHSINPNRMAALMANECRTNGWAEARFCEWHCGDQHRQGLSRLLVFEEQGVSFEFLAGLVPANEYHKIKGFSWQKRAASGFIWNATGGKEARLQVTIDSYSGKFLEAA